MIQRRGRINVHGFESFLGLKGLDPTVLESTIFTSADLLDKVLFGLLYPDLQAVLKPLFITQGPLGQSKLVVAKRVTERTSSYEKRFQDGLKVGIEKTKQDLAEEVCRCENRGFKHGWIKALQTEEALEAVGIDSASPLYHRHYFSYSDFEIEKSDDEGAE